VLKFAELYAGLGWRVVPETPGAKHPWIKSWQERATSDPQQLREWWVEEPGSGVGVATSSHLWVLDIDGKRGRDSLARLEAQNGPLPQTVLAETGGGGLHYYFRGIGKREIRNSAGKVAPGIDVRGEGGQVVAPPTLHPSGKAYEWRRSPFEQEVCKPPRWLVDLVCKVDEPITAEPVAAIDVGAGTTPYGRRVLERSVDRASGAPKGQRNSELAGAAYVAGQYVGGGEVDRRDAEIALVDAGIAAGLSRKEVERTALSGLDAGEGNPQRAPVQAAPAQLGPMQFERGSEVELGQHLAGQLGGAVYDEGAVYREGLIWERADDLRQRAQRYDGAERAAGVDRNGDPKWAPIKLSLGNVNGIVGCAEDVLSRPGWFADAPAGAVFGDTFVRVEGSEVIYEPLRPEHRARANQCVPWPIPEPSADGLRYTAPFLGETWTATGDASDRIAYLFEWLGLALLGVACRFKDSPLLVGEKDTGKSVLLALISSCFPAASRRSIPLHNLQHEYHRAAFAEARINVVSELPSRELLNGEAAKAMLAGDPVAARQPHGRVFMVRSRCAHVYAANELPVAPDPALMGRFVVIDCPNPVPQERQDRTLSAKLAQEAPHVARAALAAAEGALARGYLIRPPSSRKLSDQWAALSDPVREWSSIALEASGHSRTGSERLYRAYCSWCDAQGHRRMSSKKWSMRMKRIGWQSMRSSGTKWLARLKGDAEQEAAERWSP